jgi:hypothetical protein
LRPVTGRRDPVEDLTHRPCNHSGRDFPVHHDDTRTAHD